MKTKWFEIISLTLLAFAAIAAFACIILKAWPELVVVFFGTILLFELIKFGMDYKQ